MQFSEYFATFINFEENICSLNWMIFSSFLVIMQAITCFFFFFFSTKGKILKSQGICVVFCCKKSVICSCFSFINCMEAYLESLLDHRIPLLDQILFSICSFLFKNRLILSSDLSGGLPALHSSNKLRLLMRAIHLCKRIVI